MESGNDTTKHVGVDTSALLATLNKIAKQKNKNISEGYVFKNDGTPSINFLIVRAC
jgi:hypothetical protein